MSSLSDFFSPGPVIRDTELPGVKLDFNFGARLLVPEGDYHVRFTDLDTLNVLFDADISGTMAASIGKYYIRFRVEVWKDGKRRIVHDLALSGKNVHIAFPTGTLGDILAWFPHAAAFREKHSCDLYCSMQPEIADILKPSYPEIRFIAPGDTVPDCYASYALGLFSPSDRPVLCPVDHRTVGLWRCIPAILGLEWEERRPVLTRSEKPAVSEPYVCIAVKSTSYAKFWNNPYGWDEVTAYLKKKGYRVLCIDRERSMDVGERTVSVPEGAEDFTGALPLQERIDLLSHGDFFIGLSSGLSWLAWAAGVPMVMISGFTLPFNEFHTPYRVINYHLCNGCWNDCSLVFDLGDFYACPRHKGTDRAHECTRFLTSGQVCKVIDRLMADHRLPGRRPLS